MALKFRCLLLSDAEWLTENANDAEAAKYALDVFPVTNYEIEEWLKKDLEEKSSRHIIAELDGDPAGFVRLSFHSESARDRHVAWLGITVRRKHWRKGVGEALMKEAIRLAKDAGCRKLMLGTFEGNERAIPLYAKLGFQNEAYEDEEVFIDGSWRKGFIMGLEIASCEPKLAGTVLPRDLSAEPSAEQRDLSIRQLMTGDMDELHRLQNCPESTKSTYRLPPVTKEETKKWFEKLRSEEGKFCLACFNGKELAGYLSFQASRPPFPCLRFEEIVVDVRKRPDETSGMLVSAVKGFKERYGYRRIFAYVPETSQAVTQALENHGFKKTGSMKNRSFVDGYYVDVAVYTFP